MKLPVLHNTSPNVLDTEMVHRDLDDNKHLWKSVAYFRQSLGVYGYDEIQLVSTSYYVVIVPGMEEQLIQLAVRWKPGELEWSDPKERASFNRLVKWTSKREPKVLKITWNG